VLGGYGCLSAAIFGRDALAHLQSVVVGFGPQPPFYGRDQSLFVWFLQWGTRALTHLHNPLSTTAIFAPHGYNLAWATSIQGPALLMAPVTLLAGPVASFDLLAIAAPAVAAWTAYLLCAQLMPGRRSSAVAGGLLFGFGTYETAEMVNHLNLALVALVPLTALLVLRRHAGGISRRAFVAGLAIVLVLQLWTCTEVLATMVIFGALALGLAVLLGHRASRPAIGVTVRETLAAAALAAVLAAPFLYQAFRYPNPVQGISGANAGVDVANFLTPTRVTWLPGIGPLASSAERLRGNVTEQLAYVGLPLLLLLGAFAVSFRRRLAGRLLVSFILIATVASLGSHLVDRGARTGLGLPWGIIDQLPLLRFAVPGRFVLYVWLAIAVAAAYWLAEGRPTSRVARWGLFGLVAASLAPNVSGVPWGTRVDAPPLLRSPALARYVMKGSTVLALPFGISGSSMFWQVQADFRFRLAGGYVSGSVPNEYRPAIHLIHALEGNSFRGDLTPRLCAFIRLTGTTVILLRDGTSGSWARLLDPLGIEPAHVGGFAVLALGGALKPGGACGR